MRELRMINRGGFGVVHEVELPNGARLARKSFDPQVSSAERDKLQKRFSREVRIQSQIRHPNIMPIVEHDLNVTPPWFTMPLAQEAYDTKIERDCAASTFDPRPWQDILAAVEELHRLGYVHRDLKPQNILLVGTEWMLSDFGLILPTARNTTMLTGSKTAFGTAYYAAPEQASDFRNTPAQADIFALGCILHDAVDPTGPRIPYAQIRSVGAHGPILEKCTELDYRKRFPSVSALRAALFDLWRTAQFTPPAANEANLLDSVIASPDDVEVWRALIKHLEATTAGERKPTLQGINGQLIVRLNSLDEMLFGRLVDLLCDWASGSSFDWAFCDVVGDRLLEAYRVSNVRSRCRIVLAAIDLACSHNRFHVMTQVGAMLGAAADNGLIDRILIEIGLEPLIVSHLKRIERTVQWQRGMWNEKLAADLNARDLPPPRDDSIPSGQ